MFGSTVGGLVAVTTYGLAISELNFHQEIENSTVRFIGNWNFYEFPMNFPINPIHFE